VSFCRFLSYLSVLEHDSMCHVYLPRIAAIIPGLMDCFSFETTKMVT
jgi:hypothetical protein